MSAHRRIVRKEEISIDGCVCVWTVGEICNWYELAQNSPLCLVLPRRYPLGSERVVFLPLSLPLPPSAHCKHRAGARLKGKNRTRGGTLWQIKGKGRFAVNNLPHWPTFFSLPCQPLSEQPKLNQLNWTVSAPLQQRKKNLNTHWFKDQDRQGLRRPRPRPPAGKTSP